MLSTPDSASSFSDADGWKDEWPELRNSHFCIRTSPGWTVLESARDRIKVIVKRILNKHSYPPDLQEETVKTVLLQAELLCAEWV